MALRMLKNYILMIIGIVMVGASPSLFQKIQVHPIRYLVEIFHLLISLLTPLSMTFGDKVQRVIFPYIFQPFKQSILILLGGFILSVCLCVAIASAVSFLNNKAQERLMLLLSLFEAIPDIIYIIGIQLFIVLLSQLFHFHTIAFVSLGTHQIYMLPILVISIVPTMYLLRIELHQILEEKRKDYVEFARGKGLTSLRILVLHILRNTLRSLYIYSKQILWLMLSSLFMVEYFFNINGIMMFIYQYPHPIPLTIGLALLLTAFFIFFSTIEMILKQLSVWEESL